MGSQYGDFVQLSCVFCIIFVLYLNVQGIEVLSITPASRNSYTHRNRPSSLTKLNVQKFKKINVLALEFISRKKNFLILILWTIILAFYEFFDF